MKNLMDLNVENCNNSNKNERGDKNLILLKGKYIEFK